MGGEDERVSVWDWESPNVPFECGSGRRSEKKDGERARRG